MRTRRGSALRFALLAWVFATGLVGGACRAADPEGALEEARVVAIHDGDTLSVRTGDETLRVRLAQIDAPERGQPWGRRSREALARLAAGRSARLVVVDRDDYGRSVADLYVGEDFVNEALVRSGDAWAYPRYLRSPRILEAEDEARRAGRGLWRLPAAEREPPWEWRRAQRRGRERLRANEAPSHP